jgi:hypothetical protein
MPAAFGGYRAGPHMLGLLLCCYRGLRPPFDLRRELLSLVGWFEESSVERFSANAAPGT